ncbi:MAG TPA: hypothetical protein VFP50_01550 [Anaeromyxobacteraceae bacterium]|nr:hypothetical protein [Anaeromyxobacteraceae bacterium]
MTTPRLLCLFSSARLAEGSHVGRQAGHWTTDLDQGPCEFVPLVVDAEAGALAASGLFSAAVLVCDPADLGPALAASLAAAGHAFAAAGLPHEVVPAAAPVSVLGWLAREAPALVPACHADGEVRLASPSWWRDRARRHLAAAAPAASAAAAAEAEDLTAELAAFVARRGW